MIKRLKKWYRLLFIEMVQYQRHLADITYFKMAIALEESRLNIANIREDEHQKTMSEVLLLKLEHLLEEAEEAVKEFEKAHH